jgi:hypothetical protein
MLAGLFLKLGLLTNTGYCADLIDIVHPCLCLDLQAGNEGLIGGLHIRRNIDSMSDGRECRPLASTPLWWELCIRDNCPGLFGRVDLRYNDATFGILVRRRMDKA